MPRKIQKDDTSAVQAAIATGAALEPLVYHIRRPLRLGDHGYLVGSGARTILSPTDDFPAGQPLIDLTGTSKCVVADLKIQSTAKTRPGAGILLARSSHRSAAHHVFRSVEVKGAFSVACVVNIGSELDEWHGCRLLQGGNAPCYLTSGFWTQRMRKLLRPRLPVWPPPATRFRLARYAADGVHNFYGGYLGIYGSKPMPNIELRPGAHTLNLFGTYLSNKEARPTGQHASGGVMAVKTHRDDDWTATVLAAGCYFECGSCRYAVYAEYMPLELSAVGCRFSARLGPLGGIVRPLAW